MRVSPARLLRVARDALLLTGQLHIDELGWHLAAPLGRYRDLEPDLPADTLEGTA